MDETLRNQLKPGTKVRVTQQIAARDYSWSTPVTGTIVGFEQKPTGSWFAHSKNDRLWLDRLVIRKDDGELVVINLDPYTHVDLLQDAAAAAGDAGAKAGDEAAAAE